MLLIRIVSIWTYGENGLSPIENNTTTFYAIGNTQKPLFIVSKPLLKPLRNGFPGVGYTAVAYSHRRRFFNSSQQILQTVALHMKTQRFMLSFQATAFHMQRDISVAKTRRGYGFILAIGT
jgi:hypothetical protein